MQLRGIPIEKFRNIKILLLKYKVIVLEFPKVKEICGNFCRKSGLAHFRYFKHFG